LPPPSYSLAGAFPLIPCRDLGAPLVGGPPRHVGGAHPTTPLN
jgi:hypothetical protein